MLIIPAGAIVTVVGPPSEETGMVAVMWEGKTPRKFTVDLSRRGDRSKYGHLKSVPATHLQPSSLSEPAASINPPAASHAG